MAMLNFKYGLHKNLPAFKSGENIGTIYVTTDEKAMYVDLDGGRIRLSQIITCTYAEWNALKPPYSTEAFYYIVDKNALLKYNEADKDDDGFSTGWVQINSTAALQDALDKLTARVSKAEGDISSLGSTVGNHTTQINTLNGDVTLEGSVKKTVADALAENDIFETDIKIVNALGGIAVDADLNGMTTHEILTALLYPYVKHVVGNPSRVPASSTLEKGDNQTITSVTVSVTKKSKAITSVALYNGNVLLAEKTGAEVAGGGSFTFSGLSVSVPSTNVQLTVKVTDASGEVVSKSTPTWNFVYPYYVGSCAADAEIDEALVESLTKKVEAKGNKTITFNCDYQRAVFAYPKAHGALKSILDPNSFENLSAFTRHEVNVTGLDGTVQAYYVYANSPFTADGFNFTFKY